MVATPSLYPVDLWVDHPDRWLDRLTTLFRIFTVIPIAIVLGLLTGGNSERQEPGGVTYHYAAASIVFAPTVLMLLFR
jgi:hypothetical protein